jgi:hypothetical protein
MAESNVHNVTVGIEADTPVSVMSSEETGPADERIWIDRLTLWPAYMSNSDADVVAVCDHLIEALQEVRAHSLQRLAAEPEAVAS